MPWFYRDPTGRPPHPDVLTPAEWRVLEQVREGRTNPEIAEALGVSVNTVRTHVSSMLGKLELSDRAELAAWHGEPAEVSRVALGRTHVAGPLGWLAEHGGTWGGRIAIGAGLAAAGAVFLFAMQSMSGSGSPGGASAETPAPTATVPLEPAATPTSTPRPTFPPAPVALFPRLTVGDAVELPEGVTLYVWSGCTSCDGPPDALRRVERGDGQMLETVIFESVRPDPDAGRPYLLSGWADRDAIYVWECSAGYCGGLEPVSVDAAARLHRSINQGDTWESLGERALEVGTPFAVLDAADWGVTRASEEPTTDAEDGVFEALGVTINLAAIDPRGVVVPEGPGYGLRSEVEVGPQGDLLVQWYVRLTSRTWFYYLSRFASDGSHLATYEGFEGGPWFDDDRLIATVPFDESFGYLKLPGFPEASLPSLIDLRDGVVQPILDPFSGEPLNRNGVMGVQFR